MKIFNYAKQRGKVYIIIIELNSFCFKLKYWEHSWASVKNFEVLNCRFIHFKSYTWTIWSFLMLIKLVQYILFSWLKLKEVWNLNADPRWEANSERNRSFWYNFSTLVLTTRVSLAIYNCKWMNEQMAKGAKSKAISGKQHFKSTCS